jgi:16S rRNA (adenine1518-N6/adenine1519-N6)-dimethyltransferase
MTKIPLRSYKQETKRQLAELGHNARKRLGQNFLVDRIYLDEIVSAAELVSEDIVIEIGPGLGILTSKIAARVQKLIAIELDETLAENLKLNLSAFHNIEIVKSDILNFDLVKFSSCVKNYKVVANLPYYITSAVFRYFLEAPLKPSLAVFSIQKEVAEAIVAKPGNMNLLSVSVQFYAHPTIINYIQPEAFYPSPKVWSAIVRIKVRENPLLPLKEEKGFFNLVRAGFALRRKKLSNAFSLGLNIEKKDVTAIISKAGIDYDRRAETLSLDEWVRLWRCYKAGGIGD